MKKPSFISNVCDDLKVIFDPKNVSTMVLPWVVFSRSMVQIARQQTEDCTFINPVNKLMTNNYLGASMVLRQTHLGQRLYDKFDVEPGAGQKVFDTVTEASVQAIGGVGRILEADANLLSAVIDELQAIRTRADEAGPGGRGGAKGAGSDRA